MNGLTLLLCASAIFLVGYFVYSRFIARVLGVDPSRPTPAVAQRPVFGRRRQKRRRRR